MAGHSKWANIKHRKAAADAKKGKVFTRLIKEITVAAKLGGADANANPRLRLAMDKAREANMTKDSVQNAIKRGAGQLDGVSYEEARYEGYGPAGAAVLVECLTDNRTRTVAEVRHAFTKNGGNLGSDGSVELICAPMDFDTLKAALDKASLKPELAEITMKPATEAPLGGGDAARMRQLLDALENLDDVQNVYTTAVVD